MDLLNFALVFEVAAFPAAAMFWRHCREQRLARKRANALRMKAKH
jgi:hypothetical protein